MVIISTSKMPTNCAKTVSYDSKNPGWSNCEANCNNCTKCKPDPDTDCGQMLIASGAKHCVPPKCAAQCCKSDYKPSPNTKKNTEKGISDDTGLGTGLGTDIRTDIGTGLGTGDPIPNTSKKEGVSNPSKTHSIAAIIIGSIIAIAAGGALIFFIVKKIRYRSDRRDVIED